MFEGCKNLKSLHTPGRMNKEESVSLPGIFYVEGKEDRLTTMLTADFAGVTLRKMETNAGYVDGTDGKVFWTYDPKTKTALVTGKGTRVKTYGAVSSRGLGM